MGSRNTWTAAPSGSNATGVYEKPPRPPSVIEILTVNRNEPRCGHHSRYPSTPVARHAEETLGSSRTYD
jgi:hypothetical protein